VNTAFRYMLLRLRGSIIGWGAALAALALLVASLFDAALQMRGQLEQLLDKLPPEIMLFVGGMDRIFSPAGFLDTRFFSLMPLLLGVFAILIGSGLVASDEENGTLDLILAHPVRRFDLMIGRWLAFCVALLGILALAWLGLIVATLFTSIKFSVLAAALPFIALCGIVLWFGGLAVLLSMIVPSRAVAASLTGLILAASYFITSFARISPSMTAAARWSPLTYYQGGAALDGFNAGNFSGLVLMSVVFVALAAWLFQRRDIRIAGEGGWRWPLRKRNLPTV
jgi:ABC-2 type transport system permease protein